MASIVLTIHFWEGTQFRTHTISATKSTTIHEVVELVLATRSADDKSDASCFVAMYQGAAIDSATQLNDLLNDGDEFALMLDIRSCPQDGGESTLLTPSETLRHADSASSKATDHGKAVCGNRDEQTTATELKEQGVGADARELEVDNFEDFEEDEMDDVWDAEDDVDEYGFEASESHVSGFSVTKNENGQDREIVERRSTVRYFERMNPYRVYPLLVALTKNEIEEIVVSGVRQKAASNIRVELSEHLLVEPILPGCTCHPSIQTLQLQHANDDGECRFFVVPMIQGPVEGAHIVIRQGGKIISKLDLKAKVVPRTWTMISAVSTIVVPFILAVLQHFQINIGDNVQDSAGFYVAIASLFIGGTPPSVLTVTLFSVTLLLYWQSRARENDVFWTVSTVPADTQFARIQKLSQNDLRTAAKRLAGFLQQNPTHRKALLFYANWHFKNQAFEHALDGFERAMRLGILTGRDYFRASISAARLKNYQRAIEIVRRGELDLPEGDLPAVIFFNAGCYACRLADYNESIEYLTRAISAGYRKREKFELDPDLKPLRSDPEFQELVNAL